MMEVILDSSFILSCAKRKIDFLSPLEEEGFKMVIPREVLQELKDAKEDLKQNEKIALNSIFELIEKRKVKKVGIGSGRVDEELIRRGKEGIFIASLDKEIKRNVSNRVIISDASNDILIERD